MSKEKLTTNQFRMLVLFSTCSTSLLSMPLILGTMVGRDAWWIVIFGTLLGLPHIFLFQMLARRYPQKDIFEISRDILGNKAGVIVVLLITALPLLTVSTKLHYSLSFINNHLLPETPSAMVMFISMSIVAMGVYLGICTLGRTAEMLSIFFFIPLFTLFVLKASDIHLEFVLPFFRGEQNQYVEAILFYLAITSCNNFLILSIFPKYVSDKKRAGRAFWQGHVLACTILFLVTLLCISVLGPELMTTAYYPLFALTQRVSFGNFAERIEALLTILWFITIYFKICLYLYVSAKGIGNMFQLKNIKPLVLPLALLFLFIPLQAFEDAAADYEFYIGPAMWLSLGIGGILPIVLVLISFFTYRRKRPLNDSQKPSQGL
ncbi:MULTISPECIES: GerAB/ArcD/ProY family transporter [Shouchella]|uniref:Endospore germination permease n=2 Tax=Shouchella TaxID=2893057 RepID=A0ABY7W7W6_9BACI|nr:MULTISPECIES: endospore germination permease [Shouchella]MED4126596.1 endospore germination permease [Shouchella miscanthi]WDF04701.1 endospore germination permease [Shouchella hunanensis]GAF23962.1 spore germination protein GerKB [Bacillus sp. JCM 19047]